MELHMATYNGTSNYENIIGSSDNDLITGMGGADTLFGAGGNDTIWGDFSTLDSSYYYSDSLDGGAGNDALYGGRGNDTLVGGDGDDRLDGGDNNDSMTGGAGKDSFVASTYNSGNTETITDFQRDIDKFDVSALGISDYETALSLLNQDKSYLEFSFISGNSYSPETYVFSGVNNLESSDFIFNTRIINDTINVTSNVDGAMVFAGLGNDTIIGNSSSNNLFGESGNDVLYGGSTPTDGLYDSDTLNGGAGDDKLYAYNGHDLLLGGSGNDTLDGGFNNDTIAGGLGSDVFVARGGTQDAETDTIQDFDISSDKIDLSALNVSDYETLGYLLHNRSYYNDYQTTLSFQQGLELGGSSTHEIIINGVSASTLTSANFMFATATSNDSLIGSAYQDTLFAGLGNDKINANDGNDSLFGGAGDDTLYGGSETEGAGSNSGNDLLVGGDGNDRLYGNSQNDTLIGGNGNDTLTGGLGSDYFAGGAGIDTADYSNSTFSLRLDLRTNLAQDTDANNTDAGTDTFGDGIENLAAGSGNDTLYGSTINNTLSGNAGHDRLFGFDGNDTLMGGAGDDTLEGGSGSDTASYANLGSVVKVSLATTASQATGGAGTDVLQSIENLVGSTANDTLTGNAAANILNGNLGNDTLIGGLGNDTYIVNATTDVVQETSTLTSEIDAVQSSVTWTLGNNLEKLTLLGSSTINGIGNSSANTLIGNTGVNTLSGGSGNDTLNGGAGNDVLVGGAGTDNLTGGTGADRFDFNALSEMGVGYLRDLIADFKSGESDKIDLSTLDANAASASTNEAFSFIGGTTFSTTNAAGQVRFSGGILYGSTDADSAAEFEIQLLGVSSLTATDLIA